MNFPWELLPPGLLSVVRFVFVPIYPKLSRISQRKKSTFFSFNLHKNFTFPKHLSQLHFGYNASPINTPRRRPSDPHNPLLHIYRLEHNVQAMGVPGLLRRIRRRHLSRPGDITAMDHLPFSVLDLRARC